MISARPGATFTATLEGAPTGLTGTLGVRIDTTAGVTVLARTTAGIIEISPPSGLYVKDDLQAPATPDTYLLVWDDAADNFATEELDVTGHSVAGLEDYALTDVDRLAAFLDEPIEAGDPTTFAETLINGYSKAISRYTSREFVPKTPTSDADQPLARKFRYDGSGILNMTEPISDLRSLGGTGFGGTGGIVMFSDRPDSYHYEPVAGTTTVEGEYRLEPRSKTEEGTYLWIELPTIERARPRNSQITTVDDASLFSGPSRLNDEVTVTGYWGIGFVPDDVELACLMCCEMEWRRAAERARGVTLSEGEPGIPAQDRGGYWLPYEARSLLSQFMRPRPRMLFV